MCNTICLPSASLNLVSKFSPGLKLWVGSPMKHSSLTKKNSKKNTRRFWTNASRRRRCERSFLNCCLQFCLCWFVAVGGKKDWIAPHFFRSNSEQQERVNHIETSHWPTKMNIKPTDMRMSKAYAVLYDSSDHFAVLTQMFGSLWPRVSVQFRMYCTS